MEKKSRVISLGNWPTKTLQHHQFHLTPITKRILSQTNVSPSKILPITFHSFISHLLPENRHEEQLELFCQEVERRKKQVSILAEIRTNLILGKKNGDGEGKQSKKMHKQRVKSRRRNKEYESELRLASCRSKSRSRSYLSPSAKCSGITLSKIKSSKRVRESNLTKDKDQSDYFASFENPINSRRKQSVESTKINERQRVNAKNYHIEYGSFIGSQNSKIKQRKERIVVKKIDESKEICGQLLKSVKDWQNLDKRHQRQLSHSNGLSSREKNRLCKIHSLEKKAMRVKLGDIKSRLQSESNVDSYC